MGTVVQGQQQGVGGESCRDALCVVHLSVGSTICFSQLFASSFMHIHALVAEAAVLGTDQLIRTDQGCGVL